MTRTTIRRTLQLFPIALLASLGIRSQFFYVQRSLGSPGSFVDLAHASDRGLLENLERLRSEPRRPVIVSDTTKTILAGLEGLYLNPTEVEFPFDDYFEENLPVEPRDQAILRMSARVAPALTRQAIELMHSRQRIVRSAIFDMMGDGRGVSKNRFYRELIPPHAEDYDVLESPADLLPLNHRYRLDAAPQTLRLVPGASLPNYLIAVVSELGPSPVVTGPFGRNQGAPAFYPSEPDFFFSGAMTSVNRYLLFLVLDATPRARIVVDYTATLNNDGENRIPPIDAIGSERVHLAATGRGAGRFFSPPVAPQRIDGQPYLMLDMGREPFSMPNNKQGLMALYGRAVRLDPRWMTGFVRDISLISDDDYRSLSVPGEISHFPRDLHNPNLEFSGVYEDGWASEDVLVTLAAPVGPARLRVEGMVPAFGDDPALGIMVSVDGQPVAVEQCRPGNFTFNIPLPSMAGRQRIEIRSSRARRLTAPDTRQASFLIRAIGLDPAVISDKMRPIRPVK